MRDLIQRGEQRRRHRMNVEQRSRESLGLGPIEGEVVEFRPRQRQDRMMRMVG